MIFRATSIEIFCLSRCGFRVFIIKNDFFGEEFCGFEMFGIRFGRDKNYDEQLLFLFSQGQKWIEKRNN
jgi:hypothetical protein